MVLQQVPHHTLQQRRIQCLPHFQQHGLVKVMRIGQGLVEEPVLDGRQGYCTHYQALLGLDRVHGRADQCVVERLEVLSAVEDDIGRVFGLHQAPVVARVEMTNHRTEATNPAIQAAMDQFDALLDELETL